MRPSQPPAPGFAANTTTFLTDVPAVAAASVTLWLGLQALYRPHRHSGLLWVVGAVAAGFFAFSIREFAIAAPVAVLLAALLRDRIMEVWTVYMWRYIRGWRLQTEPTGLLEA